MRDLVFLAVQTPQTDERFRPGHNCFHFHKTRPLVEQYLSYFRERPGLVDRPRLVELGLFDGGSIPFWFEFFDPTTHVGIDIQFERIQFNLATPQGHVETFGVQVLDVFANGLFEDVQ